MEGKALRIARSNVPTYCKKPYMVMAWGATEDVTISDFGEVRATILTKLGEWN